MYKYLKITSNDFVMLWEEIDIYGYITMKSLAKCHCDLYLKLLEKNVSTNELLKVHDVVISKGKWYTKYYITWTVPKKHSYTWKNVLK